MTSLDSVLLEGGNSKNLGISNPDHTFTFLRRWPGQPAGAQTGRCPRGGHQLEGPGGQGAGAGLSLRPPPCPGEPAGPRSRAPGLRRMGAHTKGCLDIAPKTRAQHPARGQGNMTPSACCSGGPMGTAKGLCPGDFGARFRPRAPRSFSAPCRFSFLSFLSFSNQHIRLLPSTLHPGQRGWPGRSDQLSEGHQHAAGSARAYPPLSTVPAAISQSR